MIAVILVADCSGPQGTAVPVNPNDTTPPTIPVLETLGRRGGELQVTPTSGDINAALDEDESMAVAALAEDPEGVREVTIWGHGAPTCANSAVGGEFAPLATSTDLATPGGTTTSQRVISYAVRMSDYDCGPGDTLLSVTIILWAEASNHGGQTATSSRLTLSWVAP